MLPFHLDDISLRGRPTLLAFGAHSDDIEIGCGGTLLQLADRYPELEVVWVVLSATEERAAEARASAAEFLGSTASLRVIVEDFRDMYFAHEGESMRRLFERLKSEIDPDLILTHRRLLVSQFTRDLTTEGYGSRFCDAVISGTEPLRPNPITIQTYAWFARHVGDLSRDAYQLVICDEAHTALGEKTSAAIRSFPEPILSG